MLQGVKPVTMPTADAGHAVLPGVIVRNDAIAVMPSNLGKVTVSGNDDAFATAFIPPADVPSSGGATVPGNDDTWATASLPPVDVLPCYRGG